MRAFLFFSVRFGVRHFLCLTMIEAIYGHFDWMLTLPVLLTAWSPSFYKKPFEFVGLLYCIILTPSDKGRLLGCPDNYCSNRGESRQLTENESY